ITVECQGGGGGGSGGGGFSGGSHHYWSSSSSCRGSACPSRTVLWLSIVGGITGFVLLVVGIIYCKKSCTGQPSRSNVVFVQKNSQKNYELENYDSSIFKSGHWKSQYLQYGRWHGPHRCSLVFNGHSMSIKGSGSDDIGTFTLDGVYASQTQRIGLTKTYQRGTGNLSENLGHQVTIQLKWCPENNQFEGKWYVQTPKYHADALKINLEYDIRNGLLNIFVKNTSNTDKLPCQINVLSKHSQECDLISNSTDNLSVSSQLPQDLTETISDNDDNEPNICYEISTLYYYDIIDENENVEHIDLSQTMITSSSSSCFGELTTDNDDGYSTHSLDDIEQQHHHHHHHQSLAIPSSKLVVPSFSSPYDYYYSEQYVSPVRQLIEQLVWLNPFKKTMQSMMMNHMFY
ncbi:unnamed protein product, partial [Rotaria socialis]